MQNISFQLEEKKAEDENSFSSLPILPNPEPSPPVLPNPDLLYSEPQEVKNKATSEHQRLFDEEEARDSSVSSIQVFRLQDIGIRKIRGFGKDLNRLSFLMFLSLQLDCVNLLSSKLTLVYLTEFIV